MAKYNYAFNINENQAKAAGKDIAISTKKAVEVCSFVRNKSLDRAKLELKQVILGKLPVPYKRYNKGTPHRTKLGPGRYPQKTAEEILHLLEGVTANAQSKGLSTNKLMVVHICAHRASSPMKGGRQRGRSMKKTHVEVVVEEMKVEAKKNNKKSKKTEISKNTKETENKSEQKKGNDKQ